MPNDTRPYLGHRHAAPTAARSLAILGGGYIAAELGHFFGSLGTEITIINRSDRLLTAEDDDISHRFTEIYARKHHVYLNTVTRSVHRQRGTDAIRLRLAVSGQQASVAAETLLIAAGRTPNTDRLDLSRAGVQVNDRGRIMTNAPYETSVPGIWALGDIMSPYPLKHMANMEARTTAYNVVHPESQRSASWRYPPGTQVTH